MTRPGAIPEPEREWEMNDTPRPRASANPSTVTVVTLLDRARRRSRRAASDRPGPETLRGVGVSCKWSDAARAGGYFRLLNARRDVADRGCSRRRQAWRELEEGTARTMTDREERACEIADYGLVGHTISTGRPSMIPAQYIG